MRKLAIALLWSGVSVAAIHAEPPRAIRETLEYLASLQTDGGGFRMRQVEPGKNAPPASLRATLAAVRAIKYFGGKPKRTDAVRRFVDRCYDPARAAFADVPGEKVDVFSTAIGLMAVVDLQMPKEKYRGAWQYLQRSAKSFEDIRIAAAAVESWRRKGDYRDWIAAIRKLANPDGTYGKGDGQATATASAVVALLRLGAEVPNRERILAVLRNGQQLNGGFGKGTTPTDAELGSTYRVMRAFHMLEASPAEPEQVRSFVEKCRNEDGGYGPAPAEPSTAATTYFAAIIHHWLKQ